MRQFHNMFLILLCYVHLQMHRNVNYIIIITHQLPHNGGLMELLQQQKKKKSLCRMIYQTATSNAELCWWCAQSS